MFRIDPNGPVLTPPGRIVPDPPQQILALTGLRCFAALLVLIFHASSSFSLDTHAYTQPLAILGMSLFFVLSGFVIYLNYAALFAKHSFVPALRKFAVARFARLYPLYVCILLIAVAATSWKDIGASSWIYVPVIQSWVVKATNAHMYSLIKNIAHTWSVSTEIFFYVLFPGIALALARLRGPRNAIVFACAFAIAGYVLAYVLYRLGPILANAINMEPDPALLWLSYVSPYARSLEFVAGCVAAHCLIVMQDLPASPRERRFACVAAALCIVGITAIFVMSSNRILLEIDSFWQFLRANYLVAPLIAFLLIFVSRYDSILSRSLARPALVHGGELSYSIYLLHPFIITMFILTPIPPIGAFPEWLVRTGTAMAAAIVLAQGSYALIEVPARRWLRALDRKASSRQGPVLIGRSAQQQSSPETDLPVPADRSTRP